MRYWKPFFIENSRIPIWLSKISPINLGAFSFGPFVWSRKELSERARRHETIHYQQQLELLFVFQWLLYGIFWLWGYIKYRDGKRAYYRCLFEQEAYENQHNINYFEFRKWYAWLKYRV